MRSKEYYKWKKAIDLMAKIGECDRRLVEYAGKVEKKSKPTAEEKAKEVEWNKSFEDKLREFHRSGCMDYSVFTR